MSQERLPPSLITYTTDLLHQSLGPTVPANILHGFVFYGASDLQLPELGRNY